MIKLRKYQTEIAKQAADLLHEKGIAYLAMEVRTGKTLTALQAATNYGAKKVLFLTKLRAIASIKTDYELLNPPYEITIINNESLHKVTAQDFDLLISDEHHRNSSYPKPNKTTKMIRLRFANLPMIFLSGTPAIESGAQWYHSFWISAKSPFGNYANFYKWAREFVTPKTRYLGAIQVPDYSQSKDELIEPIIEPYLLRYTQSQAGFKTEIIEKVLFCEMSQTTNQLVERLLKDNIIEGKTETVLGDTAVKLMAKIHQIENGTVIFESEATAILDYSKAEFIKERFAGHKIAIFYYFKKERELLEKIFGDTICFDLETFNTTEKNIALQQISGSEGISLKAAEYLVYYNFGYSGKNFTQGRDRMTTIDRDENTVVFVMTKGGINARIYKAISKKKRYNEKLFLKDYGIKTTN